jgi:hypothetical protein
MVRAFGRPSRRQLRECVPKAWVVFYVPSLVEEGFMPTILLVLGWRLFFYSNEGNEPLHVHAQKGESECKFFLHSDIYDIEEAWTHNLSPRLRREIRQIVFEHFTLIVKEWDRHIGGKSDGHDQADHR